MAFDGTLKFDTAIDQSGFKIGISNLGSIAKTGMAAVTTAVTAATGAISALGGYSISVGKDFESSMAQVIATMGITKDTIQDGVNSYDLLKESAAAAGESTVFSASEAADALNYLALAGYDAAKAADALPAVLNLAAAGGMDLAYASDLATDAMAALGIEATSENLTRFGDEMAKTASKANTNVSQLGEAILTVGGTAQSLAGGTVELNAALGVLANRGIKGAEGGTHLRNMILSLSAPTDTAKDALDTYHFKNKLLGIDEELRLIKRTVDIYKPHKPSVEIGDKSEKITDISVRTARIIEYDMPQQKIDILASAKATATALINAGINGYVVVNSNEILIMDTPDKETATKVWRWNAGGFGYSSTGYNGTYGTAITMDGAIVADFITAGVLRGVEIVNGNDTFHVSEDGTVNASAMSITGGVINNGNGTFTVAADGTVNASAINITGGNVNISTASESYDVIQLSCGDWSHKQSPLEWRLKNTATGCEIIAQAGAMYFNNGSDTKVYIGTANGNIIAEDIRIRYDNDGTEASYSIVDTIAGLQRQIDDLRGG